MKTICTILMWLLVFFSAHSQSQKLPAGKLVPIKNKLAYTITPTGMVQNTPQIASKPLDIADKYPPMNNYRLPVKTPLKAQTIETGAFVPQKKQPILLTPIPKDSMVYSSPASGKTDSVSQVANNNQPIAATSTPVEKTQPSINKPINDNSNNIPEKITTPEQAAKVPKRVANYNQAYPCNCPPEESNAAVVKPEKQTTKKAVSNRLSEPKAIENYSNNYVQSQVSPQTAPRKRISNTPKTKIIYITAPCPQQSNVAVANRNTATNNKVKKNVTINSNKQQPGYNLSGNSIQNATVLGSQTSSKKNNTVTNHNFINTNIGYNPNKKVNTQPVAHNQPISNTATSNNYEPKVVAKPLQVSTTKINNLPCRFVVNTNGTFQVIFYPNAYRITVSQSGKVVDYSLAAAPGNQSTKNYRGLLESIGNLVLTYDYSGRLHQIGGLVIGYNYNNNIDKIGEMPVTYNYNKSVFAFGNNKVFYDDKGKALTSDIETEAPTALN